MNKALIFVVALVIILGAFGGVVFFLTKDEKPDQVSLFEEEVPIAKFDVDALLDKNLDQAIAVLGPTSSGPQQYGDWPYTTVRQEASWSVGQLRVTAIFLEGGPIGTVKADFPEDKNAVGDSGVALEMIGINPSVRKAQVNVDGVEYSFWAKPYGQIFITPSLRDKEHIHQIYISTSDMERANILATVSGFLKRYFDTNGSYPTTNNQIILWDEENLEESIFWQVILPEQMRVPLNKFRFAQPKGEFFGYKSDGQSFELSAVTEDSSYGCQVERGLCLLKIAK